MNLARIYALVFGIVYTLVGLVGFAVAPGLDSHNLILFPVNAPHNIAHLLAGVLGLAAFFMAREVLYARFMAVLFIVLAAAGFLPQPLLGIIPLGGADIVLHFLTAVLGAVAGWAYATKPRTVTA